MFRSAWRAIARRMAAARLRLIANARQVFARSWSVRLMAASGLVEGVAYCWPSSITWLPDWTPLVLLAAAFLARFVAQSDLSAPDQEA